VVLTLPAPVNCVKDERPDSWRMTGYVEFIELLILKTPCTDAT
jgi:hypothetical protein